MRKPHFSLNERKIVVGNLCYSISNDQFRDYFSQFGRVESADILKNKSGKPSGCGFIVFANVSSIEAVLSESETRKLTKLGSRLPYARRYDLTYEQWSRNIVIRDLPANISPQSLTDRLSEFGPIVKVDVATPGVGYATFKHKWDAQKCVDNDDIFLDDKKVKVLFNKEGEKGSCVRTKPNNSTSQCEPRLFIKGLHHSIDKTILQRYFSKYGSNTAFITQSKNKRLFADVIFTEKRALDKALQDDHHINGHKLTVEPYKINMRSSTSSVIEINLIELMRSSAASVTEPIKKLFPLYCHVKAVSNTLLTVATIASSFFAYPLFGIIALFIFFLYLRYENACGMKDRKYLLPGCVFTFFVAMFLTIYLTNSFGFQEFLTAKMKMYFSTKNHLRRGRW